jgi:hypothetical protein
MCFPVKSDSLLFAKFSGDFLEECAIQSIYLDSCIVSLFTRHLNQSKFDFLCVVI